MYPTKIGTLRSSQLWPMSRFRGDHPRESVDPAHHKRMLLKWAKCPITKASPLECSEAWKVIWLFLDTKVPCLYVDISFIVEQQAEAKAVLIIKPQC